MTMRILPFLLEKEFKQLFRGLVLPIVILLVTIFVINTVPRIANQQPKNMTVTVIDHDHSSLSRRLTERITATPYFRLSHTASSMPQAMAIMNREATDFIIEIPPDTERDLMRRGQAHIMVAANAVNGMKAGLGTSYLMQIVAQHNREFGTEMGVAVTDNKGIVYPRYLYNPTLDYKPYMIPGIIALIMTLFVGFLPALNIISEKEKGTMEQINVTPIGKFTFIFSKLIPYWVLGLAILFLCLGLARLLHGVTPLGSIVDILLLTSIFIIVVSSIGLVISNYSTTTRQAGLVMFFFLIIFILTSGLITPVDSMPDWSRQLTILNPMRHYISAMRAVFLRGSHLVDLHFEVLSLLLLATLSWLWAIKSYRKQQ